MNAALALFAKAPELGKVKTRLARTHGEEFALQLAEAMLGDTLALCRKMSVSTRLFLTPDGFDARALWEGVTHPQGEGDLWARLLRADARLRDEGFGQVVFIGSDAPDLPIQLMPGAFGALQQRETVVGPSSDGGFYLLGSRAPLASRLFAGVPISSRETLAALTANLEKLGAGYEKLAEWRDVDEEEDLLLFAERLQGAPDAAPLCHAVLKQWCVL